MEIARQFIIHETAHWILNHHMSSRLPGYLVLGTRHNARSLADLPDAALAELGGLLARIQKTLQSELQPKWLYISRFGHDPGFPIHFHYIPVYHWVEELFWKDERYRLLENFGANANTRSPTDGAQLTLFIWREFGESQEPPAVQGPSIHQAIGRLRRAFGQKLAVSCPS
ncbi:HIT family protein [Pseudomonas mohnii]|uniref:HIT family protein n=1 Tax=Pseudomonas TaxID=286 RepID=UPI0010296193|nr:MULTISPECIES: HIT family protein [Pseudomonas]MBH8613878.1 HIT family protein [Pseudomonas mohnii]MBM6444985.1 HIT family protein [Pseudomonas sp. MIL9]RZO07517.1 HIT family protein [Pseudomonas moorei]